MTLLLLLVAVSSEAVAVFCAAAWIVQSVGDERRSARAFFCVGAVAFFSAVALTCYLAAAPRCL